MSELSALEKVAWDAWTGAPGQGSAISLAVAAVLDALTSGPIHDAAMRKVGETRKAVFDEGLMAYPFPPTADIVWFIAAARDVRSTDDG